jgi:hypothetical protein
MFKIILKNTITNQTFTFSDLNDEGNSRFDYKFTLPIQQYSLDDGEYLYWLVEDEYVIYNGIMRVGEYKENNIEYNTNENEERRQYKG